MLPETHIGRSAVASINLLVAEARVDLRGWQSRYCGRSRWKVVFSWGLAALKFV